MPGPISDSYDPEFGTGENASIIEEEVRRLRDIVAEKIEDPTLYDIVQLCKAVRAKSKTVSIKLSVRELRIIRFALNRALESL